MKKVFSILMVALFSTAMFACGDKDNGTDTPGGGDNPGGGTTEEWVDLGLPSGLLWASCNLGATRPEDAGNYYAWGETQPKATYSADNYVHYIPDGETTHGGFTKYCNDAELGYQGYVDTLTTLESVDDAAAALLGNGARIPTKAQWEELLANCTGEWVYQNDNILCYRLTGSNGNSIFLPVTGYHDDSDVWNPGVGHYWSSTLNLEDPSWAWYFEHDYISDNAYMTYTTRTRGLAIRPVR